MSRRLVPALALLAVVLLAFALLGDGPAAVAALRSFRAGYLVPALLLAFANYCIRFVRWQAYIRALRLEVPVKTSAGVFFSGLSMAVTPGKIGELVKCVMLRQQLGTPVSLSAAAVVAERFTDVVAVIVLASLGIASQPAIRSVVSAGVVVAAVALLVLARTPKAVDRLGELLSRSVLKGRQWSWAKESADAFRTLLTGSRLAAGVSLGVAAWFAECVAFWLVIRGFGGAVPLFESSFIYATATLAGALSMLPGGLGATEASMTGLLSVVGVPLSIGSATTLVIRAVTLWWGVLVGLVFYAFNARAARRALHALAEDEVEK